MRNPFDTPRKPLFSVRGAGLHIDFTHVECSVMGLMDDGRRANVAHVTHAVRVTCATCRTTTAAAYDYASAASPTAGVPAFGPPSGGSTSVVTGVHRLSGSGTPKPGVPSSFQRTTPTRA